MAFQKGQPKLPGSGMKKGHISETKKIELELRDVIKSAFNKKGGEKWLLKQMDDNPKAFLALLGRVLPQEINGNVNVMIGLAERIAAARKRDDMVTVNQPMIEQLANETIATVITNTVLTNNLNE